jgi:hypothetical protein
MKKLMYFFVAALIFLFVACISGDTKPEDTAVELVANCSDDCQKWCCLGCKATQGKKKCIFLEDGTMPCCL